MHPLELPAAILMQVCGVHQERTFEDGDKHDIGKAWVGAAQGFAEYPPGAAGNV